MTRWIDRYLILTILTVILTACAVQGGQPAASPQPTDSETTPPQVTQPAPTQADPGPTSGGQVGEVVPLPEPVQAAVEALGQQLGVDPGMIEVVEYQSVDWPDASLGCPLPGMVYAQVVTPGYRVVLETGGQSYEYHTSLSGPGVFCSGDNLPSLPVNPGEIDDAEPWLPVD